MYLCASKCKRVRSKSIRTTKTTIYVVKEDILDKFEHLSQDTDGNRGSWEFECECEDENCRMVGAAGMLLRDRMFGTGGIQVEAIQGLDRPVYGSQWTLSTASGAAGSGGAPRAPRKAALRSGPSSSDANWLVSSLSSG